MKINGETSVCGLIGNPVEHTLSPVIHNNLATAQGHNLVYLPFLVKEGKLEDAVLGAEALNVKGLNVTVPYKSSIMDYLKDIDENAREIGAVNTLVRVNGGYKGYNTDMPGLLRAMSSENITIKDEYVIILGAGGAARAAALLCAKEGAKEIFILNRSLERAEAVSKDINHILKIEIVTPMQISDYNKLTDRKYLAIQATSVGLHPNAEDVIIEDVEFYKMLHTGVDLIYNPYETRFMSLTKSHGGKVMNGLKMLLYQGIIAYELWNDVSIDEESAKRLQKKMEEALGCI